MGRAVMRSQAELESERQFVMARRTLFALLSLLISTMFFGLHGPSEFDPASAVEPVSKVHMSMGLLFLLLAAYLAAPWPPEGKRYGAQAR